MSVGCDNGARIGIVSSRRNFAIKITTKLTFGVGVAEFLASVVGGRGTSEEKIGVGIGEIEGRVAGFDLVKRILKKKWENGGFFVKAFTEDFDTFTAKITDVVGQKTPEGLGFVAIIAADF